jgi:UDP-N-acetylglucosamine--N-acetylmuramyl-(pentapeptide) pyrophosphoryl-undecaprenol N-acetylglucosamine transferase
VLRQDDALASKLAMELRNFVLDPAKRLFMAEAARSLAKNDAADRVADAVLQEARP